MGIALGEERSRRFHSHSYLPSNRWDNNSSSVSSSLSGTSYLGLNLIAKDPEESVGKHRTKKTMDMVRFTNLYEREVTLVLLVDSRLR